MLPPFLTVASVIVHPSLMGLNHFLWIQNRIPGYVHPFLYLSKLDLSECHHSTC